MKRLMFVFLLLMIIPMSANAEFSRGIRFGVITKSSVSGYFKKSLECDMLMGKNSVALEIVTKTKTKKGNFTETIERINPWKFSGDLSFEEIIEESAGELVYVEYNQEYINTGLVYGTDYKIVNVGRIIDPLPETEMFDLTFNKAGKSDGFKIGYIVKASQKGMIVDSWEITVQEGEGGNKFSRMSVEDRELYEFIYNCVKSGSKVKIQYKDLGVMSTFDPLKDTSYRVTSVKKL